MHSPEHTKTVITEDGFALSARVFEPKSSARGTVIVNGATGAPQSYYGRFASFLARRGLRAVTYDYRGIGASRPGRLRGFSASMSDWAFYDARAVHELVRREHPGPVVLVGHSFGGQLVGLLEELRHADAALMVGAQLGYYGHWQGIERLKLAGIWHVVAPALSRTLGFLPGWAGLGVDLPAGVAREWARWCRSPDYLISDYPEAAERYARFYAPTLFYSFTDDDFAPEGATHALLDRLGPHVLHRRLAPSDIGAERIGHFGFFRPEHMKALWEPALAFIDAQLARRSPASIPLALEWPTARGGAELAADDVPN
jgi:predicted alpha/beta hydrolase